MEALVAVLGGWEIALMIAVILILFSVNWLPFSSGKAINEAEETEEDDQNAEDKGAELRPSALDPLILWLAWGFGSGRIPWAPGTFGSVVGMLWFGVLLSTRSWPVFLAGTVGGIAAAIVICGRAERILRQRDPSSIVLDEICAVPICFVPWLISEVGRNQGWPGLETFFGAQTWHISLIIFALFRLFDIAKPWPVRQSQRLPGGWGVVMDDVLAAVYVCGLSLIVFH